MNFHQFIKILRDNLLLIIGVGLIMATIIFLFKLNDPDIYSSKTTIYTGFTGGYNLESGNEFRVDITATEAKFDDLINIIKSRTTFKETALRLLAQHLMLDAPDPNIISAKYYRELMKEVPQEIKDLVVKNISDDTTAGNGDGQVSYANPVVKISDLNNSGNNNKNVLQKTKTNMPDIKNVYHIVKSGEFLYDIAKKYGTTVNQLYAWNDLSQYYGGQKLIVKKEIKPNGNADKESGEAITDKKNLTFSNTTGIFDLVSKSFEETYQNVLGEQELLHGLKQDAWEKTYENLNLFANKREKNFLNELLQSNDPFYSVKKISEVNVFRKGNSDMVELGYHSYDPAICRNSLNILTYVFAKEHIKMKARQTNSVSDYFQNEVDAAWNNLIKYEQDLLEFSQEHNIINYNEQTKYLAEQNELFRKDRFDIMAKLSKANAALETLEKEMSNRDQIKLQSETVINKRNKLAEITSRIALAEGSGSLDPDDIDSIINARKLAIEDLSNEVSKLHQFGRSPEGIALSTLLQKWIDQIIQVSEAEAEYNTIVSKRENYFDESFREYTPIGSKLKKLERKINTAEKEYLNLLHSLNLSKLKEQNIKASTIHIVDEPYLPIDPDRSLLKLLLIIGFLAGSLITAAFVFFLEYLDNTIKTPERAADLTGLNLLGVFPRIKPGVKSRRDVEFTRNRLIEIMVQKIRLEALSVKKQNSDSFHINIVSTKPGEGKSFLGRQIADKLQMGDSRVLYLKPYEVTENRSFEKFADTDNRYMPEFVFEYDIPADFINIMNTSELTHGFTFDPESFDYIILELPALLRTEYPVGLVKSADMTILTCRANRNWDMADEQVLKLFMESCTNKPFVLLNGTSMEAVKKIIGNIPRRKQQRHNKKNLAPDFDTHGKSYSGM